jgi:signal peptide peptidase SppA
MSAPDLFHLRSLVFGVPHYIAKQKLEDIVNVLALKMGHEPTQPTMMTDGDSQEHEAIESTQQIEVVKIHGTLVNRGSWVGASSGLVAYEGTRRGLLRLADDNAVSAIVLDIDSLGGEVAGCRDLVNEIDRIDRDVKPIYAIVNSKCCSAGYYLAAACREIYAIDGSMVGSIAALIVHEDQSEKDKKEGRKYTFIQSGERKTELSPHAPLSEIALNSLTEEVMATGNRFIEDVARFRGLSVTTVAGFKGALFFDQTGLAHGLVDHIMPAHEAMDVITNEVTKMPKVTPNPPANQPQGNTPAPGNTPEPEASTPEPVAAASNDALQQVASLAASQAVQLVQKQNADFVAEVNKMCALVGRNDLAGQLIQQSDGIEDARNKLFATLSAESDAAGIESTHNASNSVPDPQAEIQSAVDLIVKAGGQA